MSHALFRILLLKLVNNGKYICEANLCFSQFKLCWKLSEKTSQVHFIYVLDLTILKELQVK